MREAVYGAADNDVITLLDDDHVSFDPSHLEFPINKSVTINGNGHTIYGVNDHNSA
ncbi:hypothetical protein J5751_06215 [bacterium]|nr:hypothetical protein [bacterium]